MATVSIKQPKRLEIRNLQGSNISLNNQQHLTIYHSPIGEILIDTDGSYLVNIDLLGDGTSKPREPKEEHISISMICEWLDRYFNGKNPLITDLPIALTGTPFQNLVWELVAKIPYGETRTYDDLAINIEKIKGIEKMSRQAVGSAVGKNTIPIVIPCHRVIATDGLGGYSGGDGIETKKKLLIHEGVLKEDGDHSPSSSYYKRRFYKWHLEN